VISAGRRNEPVAHWIQHKAGRRVRLVHIGRPWAPLDRFDLIVTTAQYQLPERANVVHNLLPLHRVTDERLESEARKWKPRFAHFSRPWTAVLLGGNSGPFVFTPEKGARLGRQVNEMVKDAGGAVLISDSARTPEAAFQAFQAELDVPAYVYRWRSPGVENPYFGYLGLADAIVATGESMSMLTEACATHKPLMIFDLSDRACTGKAGRRRDSGSNIDCQPWWHLRHNFRFKPLSHRLAMRFGPKRMRRDIGVIQQQLVATGRAVWLGQAPVGERYRLPVDDLERAVAQVQGLFRA
jgi:mitochondrial fission protein ELM1